MVERLHASNEALRGKKVLVVDDDMRNIFALTTLLENQHMEVVTATNGRDAIALVEHTEDLSLVLMDIMMPEMDGYETMRQIRGAPQFRNLPILALTVKAMKGDREKCLDAGAIDYISKPVNTDQLLSLIRARTSGTSLDVGPIDGPRGRAPHDFGFRAGWSVCAAARMLSTRFG